MKGTIAIIENHIISTNTVREKLTQVLIEQGYNVIIFSTGNQKELALARSKGFYVIDVGTSNTSPFAVLQYMNKLRAGLHKVKPDICLTFTIRPAIWGNLITRILQIPTITNITGIGPLAESKSLVYKIARLLYRVVLKKTALVFFQNEEDQAIFLERGFVRKENTQIIPGSGIDFEKFKPIESNRSDDKFLFLFISRLIKDKGIMEFVQAAEGLKDKMPEVSCQVLGPYYSQNLKENIITEKQIMHWLDEGVVNYLGTTDDVRPFMAQADCIVLPSYREGLSNVLLEAGSMEIPCIATDVPGCKDVIVDGVTGMLCKVKDAGSLQDKMQEMVELQPDQRRKMGKSARERVKSKFAKQIVIDAYLQAIEKYKSQ
jgi:glycosyltransferase involved in cell wall biosynthesis